MACSGELAAMTNPKSQSNPIEMGGPTRRSLSYRWCAGLVSSRAGSAAGLFPEEFLTPLDWESGNQVRVLLAIVAVVLTVLAVACRLGFRSLPKTATFTL